MSASRGLTATAAAAGRLGPGWRPEREEQEEGAGGRTRSRAAAAWSKPRGGARRPAEARAQLRERILAASAACAAAAGPERGLSAVRSAPASPRRAGLAPRARTRARAHAHSQTHAHTRVRSPAPRPLQLLLSAPQWKAGPSRSFFKYINYSPGQPRRPTLERSRRPSRRAAGCQPRDLFISSLLGGGAEFRSATPHPKLTH